MKIVVVGGTGLIGSKVVAKLTEHGHEAIAASPATGVNTLTGEGLEEVLKGADVVVDVSNSPSFEESAATEFFRISNGNLLAAEKAAEVGHHVALSVVGTDRLAAIDHDPQSTSGYFRAKLLQEALILESGLPYSIVHATQFYEFAGSIADVGTDGDVVKLPTALIQPMAAEDVAKAVGRAAVTPPTNRITEIGGPEQYGLDEFIRIALASRKDPRTVVADDSATYYGIAIEERSLVPAGDALLGELHFGDWLAAQAAEGK
ncbi:NAD(P)H-binding protein [Streptomyces sp. SID13031]|uniref:SDR family oxidoreductase n=1 Tax=Streptomyces sp. SID13031 TaxID=2706046 RepID=UPI0013C5C351|nr:NAD(P)H-binding protein [Streptomyces sp. SID13031]NEA30493.1 NAD(P)H-binding protein [Streptomyces sp. SID13031]